MFRDKVLRPKLNRIYNDVSNETSVLRVFVLKDTFGERIKLANQRKIAVLQIIRLRYMYGP